MPDFQRIIKWDLAYMKHIATKCLSIGLMNYEPLFHSYAITDRGKDFMLQTGLFSAKGYCPPREAYGIIKTIGEENLLEICKSLFETR